MTVESFFEISEISLKVHGFYKKHKAQILRGFAPCVFALRRETIFALWLL